MGIEKILDTQRLLKSTKYGHWTITSHWGQIPNNDQENIQRLGYCAYAISDSVDDSITPDLSSGCGTQVIIGPKSVIIWSSSSEEGLEKKIKQTFNLFEWEK